MYGAGSNGAMVEECIREFVSPISMSLKKLSIE
jgi:hypothetical protein